MRVLFLAHSYPRYPMDPVGSFVLRLAVALRGEGIEVQVIAPSAPGLVSRETVEGIEVRRFRYAPARYEQLAYTGTMWTQVRQSWPARLALLSFLVSELATGWRRRRSYRPDILHAHWWFPSGLVASWMRWGRSRPPLVTTLHGSDVRLAQAAPLAARCFRRVMHATTVATAVSEWLARTAESLAPEVRAVVAPMPVVSDLFGPGRSSRPSNRLLFVGKLNEQKGIDHLLRAMAAMRTPATLDVVVGIGSNEDRTRQLASDLGIADRLRWHPLLAQADLARLYREVTALVVPALDEGLGLTAVEALLSETPVVAFASGGLMDSVIDGRTGLLVPPGDVGALAERLDALLSRPDRGAALARAGREHALATFSPEACARRYAEIYRVALASTRA